MKRGSPRLMVSALAGAGLIGTALLWNSTSTISDTNSNAQFADAPLPWITSSAQPNTSPVEYYLDAATRQALLSPEMLRMIKMVLSEAVGDDQHKRLQHARQTLLQRFPQHARPLVESLFNRYVAYHEALLSGGAPREGDLDAWQRHVRLRDQLRRAYFSQEEITAFWAEESRAETHLLKRMAVLEAPGMNDAERQAALAQVEAQSFPLEELKERRASVQPIESLRQTEYFNAQQIPEDERFAARAQAVGSEAAERLAQLDQLDADWQRRLTQYIDAPNSEKSLLAQTLFSKEERRRLEGAVALRAQQTSTKTP